MTATPAPGANNIALVTADPPAGSTIFLSSRQTVTFVFSINASERAYLNISLGRTDLFGPQCFASLSSPSIDSGTSLPLTLALFISSLAQRCTALPQEMRLFGRLIKFGFGVNTGNDLAGETFFVNYSVARWAALMWRDYEEKLIEVEIREGETYRVNIAWEPEPGGNPWR